jgi:exosome complex RNA-binding protein Rrp4
MRDSMKNVEITCRKVHTSLGKLIYGMFVQMDDAEVAKILKVRGDALKVIGDVEIVVKEVEQPKKIIRAKNDTAKSIL